MINDPNIMCVGFAFIFFMTLCVWANLGAHRLIPSKVVKIGIWIVGFYDSTIPHIEKELDRGRIAHPNRIGGRNVRSYNLTSIPLNMLFGPIYIIG